MTESQRARSNPLRPVLFIAIVFAAVAGITVFSKWWTPPEKVIWRNDLAAAQREAATSNKPVLLYFTASWCGPCRQMRRNVWTEQTVADAMNAYVPVRIDIDQHQALAEKYQAVTIPMMLVLDSDGKVTRALDHAVSADEMITWLSDR